MINSQQKQKIVEAIIAQKDNYASQAKMATAFGVAPAQLSRVLNGEHERVLSDANFISLARKLGIELRERMEWNTARTPVFEFIYNQLDVCQQQSLSALLCDIADIGKTFTAKVYVKEHKNAVYIDCSQVKSKQRLVRKIAQELGVSHTGKYIEVYEDLIFYLQTIDKPLVILDEAGDLEYAAFLELKALWNATEYTCGWYMMGADGLKAKINRNLGIKKVGYAELFRRFGSRFQKVSPDGKEEFEKFKKAQVAAVAKANGINDIQDIFAKSGGSLQRIYFEIAKTKVNG